MKHMKILLLVVVSVFLSVFGCTDNEVEMSRRDYTIKNNTDLTADITFYDRISGKIILQSSKKLNPSDQLSEKVEQTSNFDDSDSNEIFNAYLGDSVRIVFSQVKYLSYTFHPYNNEFSEPINRNIFRHSNYEDLGNERYLFKITQQDYENAEDCNGNCD